MKQLLSILFLLLLIGAMLIWDASGEQASGTDQVNQHVVEIEVSQNK